MEEILDKQTLIFYIWIAVDIKVPGYDNEKGALTPEENTCKAKI
jgi:hypothetical protein